MGFFIHVVQIYQIQKKDEQQNKEEKFIKNRNWKMTQKEIKKCNGTWYENISKQETETTVNKCMCFIMVCACFLNCTVNWFYM